MGQRLQKSNRSYKPDAAEFAVLERSLVADTRKGVRAAVESVQRLAVEAQKLRVWRGCIPSKRYRPWGLGSA